MSSMSALRHPADATLALIATGCAVAATLGDFGQLWTGNSGRPELGLAAPPAWLVIPATLAGALGIPFYALGYLVRARSAVTRAPRLAATVAVGGAVFAVLGGTVHAVTGVLVHLNAGQAASGLDPLEGILASGPIVLALWGLALLAFVVASGAELLLPQSQLERASGPFVLMAILTFAGAFLPLPWRDLLQPASVNIAHVVFFAGILGRCRGRPTEPAGHAD